MLNRLQGVFSSLQKHKVKYVVIGGIASVLHGVPRATFDLDILIEATYVLSKKDLIASKRAAGREIDWEDVRLLELDSE